MFGTSGTDGKPIVRPEKIAPSITSGSSHTQNITIIPKITISNPINHANASSSGPVVVIRSLTNTSGVAKVATSSGPVKIAPMIPLKISTVQSSPIEQKSSNYMPTVPISAVKTNPILGHSKKPQLFQTNVNSSPPNKKIINNQAVENQAKPQKNVIREMQVRVPNKRDKRFCILRFHASDRLDLASGPEVFLQRENNLKSFRHVNNIADNPSRGAGSEFGREAKDEARLKKYGVVRESYKPDDQPWLMTIGKGKTGTRRFKGVREGSVSDNVEYFIFCQCKDGNFDAYPVHAWYKMKPEINYRFLKEDEAEAEYSRLNKTLNLFNVMVKRKLTDNATEDEESVMDREINKGLKYLSTAVGDSSSVNQSSKSTANQSNQDHSRSAKSVKSERALKLTDLEEVEDDDEDSMESYSDEDDSKTGDLRDDSNRHHVKEESSNRDRRNDEFGNGGEDKKSGNADLLNSIDGLPENSKNSRLKAADRQKLFKKKQRAAAIVTRMRRGVKKRKRKSVLNSSDEEDDPNDEAQDESELDDHEGDEVDYMTNSSSDEEKLSSDEREKIYEETGVDEEIALKVLLTDISSDEEENSDSKLDQEDENDKNIRNSSSSINSANNNNNNNGSNEMNMGEEFHKFTGRSKSDSAHKPNRRLGRSSSSTSSSSSSSSSSADEDGKHSRRRRLGGRGKQDGDNSSTYSSSDSDDEDDDDDDDDLDGNEQIQKSIERSVKKAELLQKLSNSIHAKSSSLNSNLSSNSNTSITTATTSASSTNYSSSSALKRHPADGSDQLTNIKNSLSPPSKKLRVEDNPRMPSDSNSSNAGDSELLKMVRKYLMRKPITVRELLKKIRLKKLVGKNEDPQTALANVLRQLRPMKQTINGQHALSLKH